MVSICKSRGAAAGDMLTVTVAAGLRKRVAREHREAVYDGRAETVAA